MFSGMASDLYESTTFQPQVPEWAMTDNGQSPMWSEPGGETHLVQWSPVTNDPAASGQSSAYNNLHITVEYHNPAPDSFASPSYCDDQSFLSPIGGEESSSSTVIGRSGFGNDPLFVCPGPVVSDDSWSMGLGMDLSRLSLNSYDTSFESVRPPVIVDTVDQSKKREEFKNTVLSNIGLVKEPSAEDKIRLDFKQQILSNIDKIEAANLDKDAKKRDDFKSTVLSNLNR